MDKNKKIERIPNIIAGLMISVALVFDLFQFGLNFIPFIGNLMASGVEVMAFLTFFLWFKFRDVKYDGKKTFITFASALIEFVPVLNALPALTLSVILTMSLVKGEDIFENTKRGLLKINKRESFVKQKQPTFNESGGNEEKVSSNRPMLPLKIKSDSFAT